MIDRNADDPKAVGGVPVLLDALPSAEAGKVDYYSWYFASMALFQQEGPDSTRHAEWRGRLREVLLKLKDQRGSWRPAGKWCSVGGRVYATAVNALTLMAGRRYPRLLGGPNR